MRDIPRSKTSASIKSRFKDFPAKPQARESQSPAGFSCAQLGKAAFGPASKLRAAHPPNQNLNLLKPHQKPDGEVCLVICADSHARGHKPLSYACGILQIAAQIDVSREFDRFYEI